MDRGRSWLDALSDGQMFRDWLSLIASFFFSLFYVGFLSTMYVLSLSLVVVLVGIPLLMFTLAITRNLAVVDRQAMAAILNVPLREVADDVDPRGANLGERLGMYLGSMTTWRSLLYLAAKLPIGLLSISLAVLIVPVLAVELLILAPLTIDMRLISVRLLHFSAVNLTRLHGLLLPRQKSKRDVSRLELREVEEPRYYITDDGEIGIAARGG